MDPQTWIAAVRNPTDTVAVAKVGLESYRDAMGGSFDQAGEPWEDLIRGSAKLLCLAFSRSSPDELMELRDCLEGRGPFVEPAIAEPLSDALAHHFLIEDSIKAGRSTTLSELFAIAHDIEAYIRPGLLRLLWAAETASEDTRKRYSAYHLDTDGKEGSVGYALRRLKDWRAKSSRTVLDNLESETFGSFLESVSRKESEKLGVDDLRNWVFHRSFAFTREGVLLGLHPAPGVRILLSRPEVTNWRQRNLALCRSSSPSRQCS